MNDREVLLIAFGALKVNGAKSVVEIVEGHLFGDKSAPTRWPYQAPAPDKSTEIAIPVTLKMSEPIEEKPSTPGDYRLKRHILGPVGLKLSECDWKKLKAGVAKYRDAIALGPVHPEAVKDLEAAELYLKSDTEQEYKKEST